MEQVPGSVLEPGSLAPFVRGVHTVFHCAARISITGGQGGRVWRINVDGVRHVAEAALRAGVRRFVHVSSCHAFDLTSPGLDERGPRPGRRHPVYDRSKAAGEAALRGVTGLDSVIVNPAGILGPWDFGPSRMGRALLAVRDRRLPALVDGGFYFVDVRDVVEAMLVAEARGRSGANYLLGGHFRCLAELMALAADVCGSRAPRFVAPMWLARLVAPPLGLWGRVSGSEPLFTPEALHALRIPADAMDDARARRELDFAPRSLRATLTAVYESFERLGR